MYITIIIIWYFKLEIRAYFGQEQDGKITGTLKILMHQKYPIQLLLIMEEAEWIIILFSDFITPIEIYPDFLDSIFTALSVFKNSLS